MKASFKMEWWMVKVRNWNSKKAKELILGKTKNIIQENGKMVKSKDLE